ncbi:MAG: VirB8/TrbF family protein [Arcobacteraceae bacterium]
MGEKQRDNSFNENKNEYNFFVLLNRVIVGLTLLSITLTIVLAIVVFRDKTELIIVEFKDGFDNYAIVHKPGEDITANKALRDREFKRYVKARETLLNIADDERRRFIEIVHPMSSDEVYSLFEDAYYTNVELTKKHDFKRTVDYKTMNVTDISKNVSIVEFTLIDSFKSQKETITSKQRFKATIHYTTHEQKVNYDEKEFNPIGIRINKYSLVAIEK